MNKSQNCVLVIFGASGDLTKRKLIPGLFNLYKRDLLPQGFAVLGVGRTELDDSGFRLRMLEGLDSAEGTDAASGKQLDNFIKGLYYQAVDTAGREGYSILGAKLKGINQKIDARGNYLFYLSTPPSLFGPIAAGLASQGLNLDADRNGWKRLVVEKPFGYDLSSARILNDDLHNSFAESQLYRIDHYLGKETVQNMLVLRFANAIYEPLWNRNYIGRVEITAAESIGIEKRGGYYEGVGALRDMFQNHLLHVVGMIAMEPPATFNANAVRNETMKVFESLRPMAVEDVDKYVVRGQYTESTIRGEKAANYRDEEAVSHFSMTDTYVAVKFFIDNWRWADVPFYVRTGKRLPTRVTEAVIHFKQAPHRLFGRTDDQCYGCNQLIIRIQPDEGILMKFNLKLPGEGFETKTVNMDFHYSELSDLYSPEAYERLLLDCIIGDATLYARNDAVEACWKFIDPILTAWRENEDIKLYGYPAGTWGPTRASELLGDPSLDWRYPCRNLSNDGEYCEL